MKTTLYLKSFASLDYRQSIIFWSGVQKLKDERLEDWLMTSEREICCSCDNGSAFVLVMAEDRYVFKHSSKYGWKCIKGENQCIFGWNLPNSKRKRDMLQ